ncbi:DUF6746 family protein [Roseovarius salinarum]|uniref:DUF6746 family protein n=1 Tax=Roseovarius salinarum TaxID=1981892 RepID=UPI000C332C92|nr:DUF6746 family protein [Roseovarius salinarum]
MKPILPFALGALLVAAPALAGDEVDHYHAEPSETLEQAIANFSEYNAKVAEVLEREDLTRADMEEIHQYTYTIEEALAKINETTDALAVTLEEVHLSSESDNPAKLRGVAEVYLETAQKVVP